MATRKEEYSEEYSPLYHEEIDEQRGGNESSSKPQYTYSDSRARAPVWLYAIILFLILSNGVQIGLSYRGAKRTHEDTHPPPSEYANPPEIPTQYKKFWWNTEYSSLNQTLQDELWDSVVWTHGMIAVDREWATSQKWHDTMPLPEDKSKGIYLLEAYHEVHCLKVLREILNQSFSGVAFADEHVTHAHAAHCFDYLLQVAMCNADSAPLYTYGSTYVGYGQIHKCKDWDALRDYATENSACFDGNEEVSLLEQFGHCDHGDGLIFGTPQKDNKLS